MYTIVYLGFQNFYWSFRPVVVISIRNELE